jgi:hypothetical protein
MDPGRLTDSSLNLKQLALALGGEVVGGQVVCPGPGHSPGDRSLAVRLSAESPFGFIAFSHAADDWRLCRDHVLRKLGRGYPDPTSTRNPPSGRSKPTTRPPTESARHTR